MGNKQGKLEDRERKGSKKKKTKRSASTIEIGEARKTDQDAGSAAAPFTRGFRAGNNRPGIQKYQSYAGPSTSGTSTPQTEQQQPFDVKIYRHSAAPTGGRYRSLPRNMGAGAMNRSRSVTSSIYQSSGTLNREPVGNGDRVAYKRYSHIPASSHHPNLNDTRESIRSSVTGLNTTFSGLNTSYRELANYRVVTDDFPDTPTIRRRLEQFETQFAKCFTALYSRLSETVQLAAVSIAVCLGPNGRHQVSLYQYLTSDEVPQDLNETSSSSSSSRERYVLTIPESLFHGVKHVRNQRIPDRRQWIALAKELVTCLAVEVADELSRIFEYQIVLLGDGLPIDLLARHAVECALDYLKSGNRFLDRNTLIAGVLGGGGRAADAAAMRVISVVIGEREFKWNLSHLFKKCGLRKESLLFCPKVSPRESGSFVPWSYFTSPDSNSQTYGYRAMVLDRDPVHGYYVVAREDEVRFTQAAGWNPEDVHRRYNPFRRLIGKEVMDEYCSVTKDADNVTLADYVAKIQGYEYARDTIQPIYRPLGMVSNLARGSRIGSSVSSLLSTGSINSRALSRRDEEVATRLHSQFPNVKQIQVTSTVLLRNPSSSTPTSSGPPPPLPPPTFYPRTGPHGWRGYRSESCSVASEDIGGYERDVTAGFGAPRTRNSATFAARQEAPPAAQRRLYQSQRPHSSRSVSSYNSGSGYSNHYGRSLSPVTATGYRPSSVSSGGPGYNHTTVAPRGGSTISGPSSNRPDAGFVNQASTSFNRGPTHAGQPVSQRPPHAVRGVSSPRAATSNNPDFLNFDAFLGMIKPDEGGKVVPPGSSSNGHYGGRRDGQMSPFATTGVQNRTQSNQANGNVVYSVSMKDRSEFGKDADYNCRRTALSHV